MSLFTAEQMTSIITGVTDSVQGAAPAIVGLLGLSIGVSFVLRLIKKAK